MGWRAKPRQGEKVMNVHVRSVLALLVASHHCMGRGGQDERSELGYDVTNHGKREADQKDHHPNRARDGQFTNIKP